MNKKEVEDIYKGFQYNMTMKDQIQYIADNKDFFVVVLDNDCSFITLSDKARSYIDEDEIDSLSDSVDNQLIECVGNEYGVSVLLNMLGIKSKGC